MAEQLEKKEDGILVGKGSIIIPMEKLQEYSPKLAELIRESEREIKITSLESVKGVEQVKMFVAYNYENFERAVSAMEKRINTWLVENKGIKVIERKANVEAYQSCVIFTVIIHYTY